MSLVRAAAAGLLAVASLAFLAGLLLVTRPTPPGGSGPAAAVGVEATAEIGATSQRSLPHRAPSRLPRRRGESRPARTGGVPRGTAGPPRLFLACR